jgi:hypothetical protein
MAEYGPEPGSAKSRWGTNPPVESTVVEIPRRVAGHAEARARIVPQSRGTEGEHATTEAPRSPPKARQSIALLPRVRPRTWADSVPKTLVLPLQQGAVVIRSHRSGTPALRDQR